MTETDAGRAPVHRLREVHVYGNSFIDVFDDEVAFADDTRGRYLRIVHAGGHGGGVVVLPVHDGTVGMVRTYRYPAGAWEWGLPRGFASDADPFNTARSELREELGVVPLELRRIGAFSADSGLFASRVTVVLAIIGDASGRPEDVREIDATRWVPIDELWSLVAEEGFEDGMTLAALALVRATGALSDQ
jgi:8-oxo-dGTP pyrophosphatase MutT (NUDIX family)